MSAELEFIIELGLAQTMCLNYNHYIIGVCIFIN